MNDNEMRAEVERYLRELSSELKREKVRASRRRELLEDLRGHIEEGWAGSPEHSGAALMNLLERLGDPHTLAQEERERLGLPEPGAEDGPGFLEVTAIALTVLFWPVGAFGLGLLAAVLAPAYTLLKRLRCTRSQPFSRSSSTLALGSGSGTIW